MKRNYPSVFMLAALALAMTACDNEEIPVPPSYSDQYIEFGAPSIHVEAETKVGPVEKLPDGSSFGVLGYCQAQTTQNDPTPVESSGALPWENKKNLIKPTLFYNTKVTYSGGICTYNNPVKWFEPKDYLYSFFAYYPFGTESGFSMVSNENTFGAPSVKFTMPVGEANSENYDLNQHEIPDAMVAQEIDVTRNEGVVPLNFYHILAGLNFQVNNYNKDPEDSSTGTKLIVHSVKLYGTFYKSIVINFDKGYDYPNETYQGTYTLVNSDIEVEAGTSQTEIGGRTLLLVSNISQTGKDNGYFGNIKVKIEYTFGGERKSQEFTRPENFLPAGGTIYTAQLNFIGNAFVLNFIVDNNYQWEDGGDSDITFE